MLKRIAFTLRIGGDDPERFTTFCGFELPPMSRKFAGSPP